MIHKWLGPFGLLLVFNFSPQLHRTTSSTELRKKKSYGIVTTVKLRDIFTWW